MERSADWIDQAEGDLQNARSDLEVSVFIIKNNLHSAGINREDDFKLLEGV